jgi:hypothetical protein
MSLFAALAVGLVPGAACLADTPITDLKQFPGVRISGTITHVFGNEFVLQDPTGSVLVDTGPEWFKRHEFKVGEWLTVIGHMDDGDFDAYIIETADGTNLTIRPPSGPPPWSRDRP